MRLHTHGTYPEKWPQIARQTKDEAGNLCIRCKHPHDPEAGRTLTVHHLNGNKSDCRWHNLLALCQACHLSIQARVNPDQAWVMTEHTPWFRIYVAGLYASKYLGVELTREECEARLDELLGLERRAVLGVAS